MRHADDLSKLVGATVGRALEEHLASSGRINSGRPCRGGLGWVRVEKLTDEGDAVRVVFVVECDRLQQY